jgi:ketosteroid isomerase-like protein
MALCICVAVWALDVLVHGQTSIGTTGSERDDEAAIRRLEQGFAEAVKARDIDKMMAGYERGQKLVFFDVVPRKEHVGWEAYRKDWQGFLSSFNGPISFEIKGLEINVVGDIAYGYNFPHVAGQKKNGSHVDYSVRVTDVYRKMDGKWLIVQEHVSVPVDLKTGKADLESGQ